MKGAGPRGRPPAPYTPQGASKAQVASVARAVRSLERKGLVATSPSNAVHRRRQVRAI
jgi:DNA-binding MarR family transcriptional regulator